MKSINLNKSKTREFWLLVVRTYCVKYKIRKNKRKLIYIRKRRVFIPKARSSNALSSDDTLHYSPLEYKAPGLAHI